MPTRLVNPPRTARALSGRGRLPNAENLLRRSPEDLVRILGRFGIEPDVAAMERRANAAFERLDELLERGLQPDAATWDAIQKQVEGDVTRQLRQMAKTAITHYRNELGKRQSPRATWVTVADSAVCPSCEPRHGETRTYREWERLGMPGSSVLICSRECRCSLEAEAP